MSRVKTTKLKILFLESSKAKLIFNGRIVLENHLLKNNKLSIFVILLFIDNDFLWNATKTVVDKIKFILYKPEKDYTVR